MKKALSLFLAMLMLISVFSVSAFAATTPEITSAVAGYYGVALEWSADVSAAGYGVFRLDSAESEGELVADVATTSYVDSKVTYGETYKYVIASKSVDGTFAPVDFTNATKVTYNRVQVKKVYSNYDGVNLVWNATPASKNGYRIFRQVGAEKPVFLADVKGTSYTDSTVTYQGQYKYAIVSLDASLEYGESLDWNNAIAVNYSLVDVKVPTITNDGVELIWTKVDGAEGYVIYRKSSKPGDVGAVVGSTGADVCKFTDKAVEKGVTYSYCVIVRDSGAKPDYANGRSVKYSLVKFYKHINQFDGLMLEWTPAANASKYFLYKNGEFVAELDTNSYLDKDVANGFRYEYSLMVQFKNGVLADFTYDSLVETKNYKDENEYKNGLLYIKPTCSRIELIDNVPYHIFDTKLDKTVIDIQPTVYNVGYKHYVCAECGSHSTKKVVAQLAPKTPEIISLHNTNLGVKLSWNVVDGADLYVVYRRATANGYSSGWQIIRTLTGTTCYDNTVKTGVYYKYAVKAVRRTAYASPVAKVANEDGTLSLFWATNFARANGYYIYRKDDATSNFWNTIGLISDNRSFYSEASKKYLTYFVDTNPNPEATGYCVRGVLISGLGSGRVIRAVKTPDGHAVKNNTSGILFSWNKVEGATSYRVYRKLSVERYWTFMGYTTKTYYPDYDTASGVTYEYTVRAVSYGHFSDYDRDGATITRLDAPKLVSAKSSREGITVQFEQVEGATRYNIYRKEPGKTWQMIGKVTDLKSSAYLDRFAVKGVTYTYTVRAVEGTDMSSYYSGISCKDLY